MQSKSFFSMILVLVLVGLASTSIFVVDERQRAIKLRFGEVVEADIMPGVHFKVPWVHQVKKFDARLLTLDSKPERFLTVGKKFVEVDSFIKWRIANVLTYYQSTAGDRFRAANLLANVVNKGLRDQFAARSLQEVVSGERDELMSELTRVTNEQAREQFGMEVVDIRVKGIDLPEDLSLNVYRRMRTEREREANELRSQGNELAEGIRADADRQKVVLEARAYSDAERIRGEGDAKSAETYAQAFNNNREFYSFTRSLKAYEETFASGQDIILLKPDSEFFRFLKDSKGKR
jgi:membrane protease subunit HflC